MYAERKRIHRDCRSWRERHFEEQAFGTRTRLAADFAIAFYDAFKDGLSIGKAVHQARGEIRKQDEKNSTWLAYYLYGNPDCVLRSGPQTPEH